MLKNKLLSAMGGAPANYIEDVFSTWLYTGNGSTQTINNGVDLAGKGGMTWIKTRSVVESHVVVDTARGAANALRPNSTAASINDASRVSAFTASGFTVGNNGETNDTGVAYASWTFREQPKFFDVVTFTAPSSGVATINHNLGSVPGCIILKITNGNGSWFVYHRGLSDPLNQTVALNSANAAVSQPGYWTSVNSTSVQLTVGTALVAGFSYVMYVFAHNAGGFGNSGTDNVISCGTYTADGSGNATVNLGYEPQFVLDKITTVGDWRMFDNMRGIATGGVDARLLANDSQAEYNAYDFINLTSTGFTTRLSQPGDTYIYIAIRRGPMKVPTDGTSVFSPFTTAAATGTAVTTNFPVDFQLYKYRAGIDYWFDVDRLRGVNSTTTANSTPWLDTTATTAEATATNVSRNWGNTGFEVPGIVGGASNVFYSFRRAPGFFDEVCFTQASGTQNHNLGVAPELVILKSRSTADAWYVFAAQNGFGELNRTVAWAGLGNGSGLGVNLANVTSTTLSKFGVFGTGNTAVAYMFATLAGVSKVGTYTGTATTLQINCGFTTGARFVLIKRTDSTGDWYVWDSARGIVSGNDPYLLLNSTAAEVTSTDYVDTAATGFEISSTAPAAINASGGTFIFLAIA